MRRFRPDQQPADKGMGASLDDELLGHLAGNERRPAIEPIGDRKSRTPRKDPTCRGAVDRRIPLDHISEFKRNISLSRTAPSSSIRHRSSACGPTDHSDSSST